MASKEMKLSVVKVRKICASGKELREEVVFERVSGELVETFQAYLDSCASESESIKHGTSLSVAIKRSGESQSSRFTVSDKAKFCLDKYVALQVWWYGHVREVLKSE